MTGETPHDLIERLERARTDFWAHTRMDCLREAADALAELEANHAEYERIIGPMTYREVADALSSKDKALEEMRAELAEFDETNRMMVKHADIRRAELEEMRAELERVKAALDNVAERHLAFRELLIALMDASPPNETAEAFVSRFTEALEVVADAFDAARAQAEGETP